MLNLAMGVTFEADRLSSEQIETSQETQKRQKESRWHRRRCSLMRLLDLRTLKNNYGWQRTYAHFCDTTVLGTCGDDSC